jgi:uncharacterized membrane protein
VFRRAAYLPAVQRDASKSVTGMVPRLALSRIALAAAAGVTVTVSVWARQSWAVSLISGWDAGGLILVALAWIIILTADPDGTRKRAAADDPGRTIVYAVVLLTSASSLLAAVVVQRQASAVAPRSEALLAGLCILTVALSWFLTHTTFTLRYAHLYYRDDDNIGGAEFPGGAMPSYMDFAYFAFTVGMCFQVSDVQVTSPQIRRAVLLHATMSFVYNTAILAFVLNLVFALAG